MLKRVRRLASTLSRGGLQLWIDLASGREGGVVSTRKASIDRFATGDVLRDRCRGCLLGTAVGDALGAPGEFLSADAIRSSLRAGRDHAPASVGRSAARQLHRRHADVAGHGGGAGAGGGGGASRGSVRSRAAVLAEYIAWHDAQADPLQRRHPGHTCMTALRAAKAGHAGPAANWSKGCGGVMRSAPAGLAPARRPAFSLGADLAALTHGHPSGYLSAGFVSDLVRRLADGATLEDAVHGQRRRA